MSTKNPISIITVAVCALGLCIPAAAQHIDSKVGLDGSRKVIIDSGTFAGVYSESPLVAYLGDLYQVVSPMEPLSEDQLQAILPDSDFRAYMKARGTSRFSHDVLGKAAIVSALTGGSVVLVHLVGSEGGAWNHSKCITYGCAAAIGVGMAGAVAAAILTSACNAKIADIACRYNDSIRTSAELSFGSAPNGMGLTLQF